MLFVKVFDCLTCKKAKNLTGTCQEGRTSEPDGRALVKKILVKHGSTFQPALQAFFNKQQQQQQQQQVDSLNQRSDNAYTRVSGHSKTGNCYRESFQDKKQNNLFYRNVFWCRGGELIQKTKIIKFFNFGDSLGNISWEFLERMLS